MAHRNRGEEVASTPGGSVATAESSSAIIRPHGTEREDAERRTPPPLSQTAAQDLRSLNRVESHEVRLIISIPALMFLSTLACAIAIHVFLLKAGEGFPSTLAQTYFEHLASEALLVGGVVAVVSGLCGLILAWSIVHPLRALIRAMRRAARGDLAQVSRVPRMAELSALGSSFNSLVGQLQDLFQERDMQMRETARGSVLSISADGRLLAADSELNRVLGVAGTELLGRPIADALRRLFRGPANEPFHRAVERCVKEALSGRQAVETAELFRAGEESPILVSLAAIPLEAASDKDPAILLDLRDFSERRGFYEQMQRADRLAAVGTLATGIAHEIRNPLASIRAMTELLSYDLPPAPPAPEQSIPDDATPPNGPYGSHEYLKRILKEVDRLDRLVVGIRDFAQPAEFRAEPTNLNRLLKEAYETARPRVTDLPEERLTVRWELDPELPTVCVEEARVHQALLNLMLNALEALAPQGGELVIGSRVLKENSKRPVTLSVSNTGGPIPREVREHLFEPFFTTKAKGTGLGLPIAYQIVVANRGVLELQSREGMVRAFVRFPLEGRYARPTGGNHSPGVDPNLTPLPEDML